VAIANKETSYIDTAIGLFIVTIADVRETTDTEAIRATTKQTAHMQHYSRLIQDDMFETSPIALTETNLKSLQKLLSLGCITSIVLSRNKQEEFCNQR